MSVGIVRIELNLVLRIGGTGQHEVEFPVIISGLLGEVERLVRRSRSVLAMKPLPLRRELVVEVFYGAHGSLRVEVLVHSRGCSNTVLAPSLGADGLDVGFAGGGGRNELVGLYVRKPDRASDLRVSTRRQACGYCDRGQEAHDL